jgi:hypothetical protein
MENFAHPLMTKGVAEKGSEKEKTGFFLIPSNLNLP